MKKFEPAKDSKGNPMSVNYALPITFVIDEFFIKKSPQLRAFYLTNYLN